MKTLANVMTTTLQKIEAKANIIMASQQMRDRQVGSLVVFRQGELMRDQEEEIIGIISETDIIRKAGRDNLIVIAGQDKLVQLNREELLVDTGDVQLDKELEGYIQVHTGVGRRMMMRLSAGH